MKHLKKLLLVLTFGLFLPFFTQAALIPVSVYRDTVGLFIRPLITTDGLRIPSLTNCDTIDTDGDGDFTCGTDGGGAGGGIAWPFTKQADGSQGTTTVMSFLGGFYSSASSTLIDFQATNGTTTNATSTTLYSSLITSPSIKIVENGILAFTNAAGGASFAFQDENGLTRLNIDNSINSRALSIDNGNSYTSLDFSNIVNGDRTVFFPDLNGTFLYATGSQNFILANGTTTNATTTNLFVSGLASTTNLRATIGLFADGSATTPSVAFQNDPDTGIYSPGANQIGFSSSGSLSGAITAGGIFMSSGSASLPAFSFFNDTNTGMYNFAADTIGISSGGTLAGLFTTASSTLMGNLHISGNSTTTSATTTNLHITSNITGYEIMPTSIYASSTLDVDGNFGPTGTTTYQFFYPKAVKTISIGCKLTSGVGTALFQVGNGSASSTVFCSSTLSTSATAVTTNGLAPFYVSFGTASANAGEALYSVFEQLQVAP